LERRRIEPLEILEKDDERLEPCRSEGPSDEQLEEAPSLNVRSGDDRRVVRRQLHIEERCDQRQPLDWIEADDRESSLELGDLPFDAFVTSPRLALAHELAQ